MSWNNFAEQISAQPDYAAGTAPLKITKTATRDQVLYVAGEGDRKKARVVFIASALLAEEAKETASSVSGSLIKQQPRYLKGPSGSALRDCMLGGGYIDILEDCYYTAVCKWLLPKENRTKPTKQQIEWGIPALREELKAIKPDIIVCLGKTAFDIVAKAKISMQDARGAWFESEEFKAKVYLMEEVTKVTSKPELVPVFHNDAKQIRRMLDSISGIEVPQVEQNYSVIASMSDLHTWISQMEEGAFKMFSVDCEWGGNNHIDGQLRSIQFCWKPGHACYFKFRDETGEYCFEGGTYQDVGKVLQPYLNRPDVKYIGHHISADLPWMHTWLGLDWYEKAFLDTEFAQQCCDEYEELSLEKLALKYTDLGKYDIDLIIWKKSNKQRFDAGYAYIPDEILIPYACKDVDTVMRAAPCLLQDLNRQKLTNYYFSIFNPFVTDVFTCFAITGLPMDIERMDELRDLYTYCRDRLNVLLQRDIYEESKCLLAEAFADPTVHNMAMHEESKAGVSDEHKQKWLDRARAKVDQLVEMIEKENDIHGAWGYLKEYIKDPTVVLKFKNLFDHMVDARNFNLRSGTHMRRWLFDVKGLRPVKSVANRDKGLPSIPWSKVDSLPAHAQQSYTPSIDKQSLEILSEEYNYDMLHQLIRLNAVGNICKAFLKTPDVDEDGNLIRENGLHFFLCQDSRVHGQYSTTETGRPRAWKPNSLNWPKWVNKKIGEGISRVLKSDVANGCLPDRFVRYLEGDIPSLRSCVKAPDGWCMVESDYQTAEVRGLAYISGDDNLIKILTEPDSQFGLSIDSKKPLRLSYDDNCGIPAENQDSALITPMDSENLMRDEAGELIHPAVDLHWSLAEMMYGTPREKLDKDIHRGAAKVGNFQSMYGASATTLERKIEQDIGKKPDEGIGDRILMALAKRQPAATGFLQSMETKPIDPGYLVAASGRIRRFATHARMGIRGSTSRAEDGLIKALGREARNFYMQSSVADTSARAGKWLLDYYIKHNMQARPLVILYDSVVTLCPLEERNVVAELHQTFMTTKNTWTYYGKEMHYPIDNEFVMRWSTKLTPDEEAIICAELQNE